MAEWSPEVVLRSTKGHSQATSEYTGRWGVFNLESTFGLTRDEALAVSDHFPVWAEFQVVEAGSRANLADRIPGLPR